MIKITIKDILNVLDEAKKKGIVKFASNDVFDKAELGKYSDHYRFLYYSFILSDKTSLNENNADIYYLYGKTYLVILSAYYKCYCELFGKEPFNLAQQFFDYLEIGEEYGWHGDPSIDICIGKEIKNEHTLSVQLIKGYNVNGLPMLFEKQTIDFELSIDNKNLLTKANLFKNYFEYPHRGYANKEEKDKSDFLNGMNLVQAAEETIKRNQNLLEVLNNIKQKNETT